MKILPQSKSKFQQRFINLPAAETNMFRFAGMRLVCDECSAPLHLYGEHFVESYTNGDANILRCLCDLHAEELELGVAK